jgi:hypothetical protein
VIEAYDQELIRKSLGEPGVNEPGYRMLTPGEIILYGDEILLFGVWSPVNGTAIGLPVPAYPSVRRPTSPAPSHTPCESMQYYDLVPSDLIEDGDELLVPGWNYNWVACGAYIIGDMAAGRTIRRPLPGCPYPGMEYKVYPKGYLVEAKLRDCDAAWDGHDWLPIQYVIDNEGCVGRILENNFVRCKKIYP